MGTEMASRLLDAGCDLAVYNRTRAKAEPLGAKGAEIANSPAGLADRDIVFTTVGSSEDLIAVILGMDGLLSNDTGPAVLRPGRSGKKRRPGERRCSPRRSAAIRA
jgi:3-hydroxyisobutyrate dehydrogenase-like beta-hydroxyacid dehydrogenase